MTRKNILILLIAFASLSLSKCYMIANKAISAGEASLMRYRLSSANMRSISTTSLHASSPLLSLTASVTAMQTGFLAIKSDPWYVWTMLSMASTAGLLAEKTNIGATLSSPLTTTLLTMIFCNIGLLPAQSPVYNTIMKVLVPLAIPLLLLDADIKKCIKKTGSLLKAFLVGALGTFVGTLVAYILVPMKYLRGSVSIAGALCARHVSQATVRC
jgi:hypothetical protein